jgi:ribonucleoside-diphosphate reductase alpha chain
VAPGSMNAVSMQGGGSSAQSAQTAPARVDDTPASDIKFCSIDNPDCEACQ